MKPTRSKSNELNRPSLLNMQTLGDVLKWAHKRPKHILENFLPAGETVYVYFESGVDTRIFGLLAIYAVAAGKDLPPFGVGAGVPVLYCSGAGSKYSDEKRFQLISNRDPFESSRKRAYENMKIYHRDHEGDAPLFLNSRHDQEIFINSIPHGTEFIVLDDAFSWVQRGSEMDCMEKSDFTMFLNSLNALGITVLIFISGTKKAVLHGEISVQSDCHNVISLTQDKGAPREFGGGFNVIRRRLDEDESVPTNFQFWYKVVNGEFDFGWECREQLSTTAAKKIEMTERLMKVDMLLKQDKPQKEIAALLDVDAATVSRDVAKPKEAKHEPKPEEGEA